MAMDYQSYASLGLNLNRQKYGPLDISNVFTSEADLKYYLTKGTFTEGVSEYWTNVTPYPYEGQVLATVIDGVVSVYALALDADGNFTTQEIGAKVETDDKTIRLVDGKLELVGLPTDTAGKTYVPSFVNGVLTWAEPDTSTAEGQQQAIDGLTASVANLGAAVNGKPAEGVEGEDGYVAPVVGLVDKVAALEAVDNATQAEFDAYKEVVTAAIADALAEAKQYADDNDSSYDDTVLTERIEEIEKDYLKAVDKYDDTDLKNRVKAIEDDYLKAEDKYDDAELAGKVSTLEGVVGSAESGLVKGVADNAKAISDLDRAYKTADEVVLDSANTYTDEQITGLEVAIEKKGDVEYIVIKNALGVEVASVDASQFVQDSFLDDVSYNVDTRKVSFTWVMGDGSTKTDEIDIADLVDVYTAGNGLKVENNEFSINTDVVATVEELNKVKETAEAAQTAQEVSDAIDAKILAENLSQYAVKTDVETELDKKLDKATYEADRAQYAEDKATFALKSDVETGLAGKVDNATLEGYYTKTEVESKGYAVATDVDNTYATKAALKEHEDKIAEDLSAYAKTSDVNVELAKKIESGAIAHSSESAAEGVTVDGTKLNIVVDAYTKSETRDYVAEVIRDMTGGESAADVLRDLNAHITTYTEKVGQIDAKDAAQDTAIAAAQAQADKGVADAAKVAGDLVTANSNISANAREIDVVKGSITTVTETINGKISGLEAKDIELAGSISGLSASVESHSSTIGEHTSAIVALQNKDTELAALIKGNTDKFANYYDKDAVDAKVKAAIDAIPEVDFEPYAKTEEVDAVVEAINATLATKANADDVYSKTDADAKFLTEVQVKSVVDKVVADVSDTDTIEGLVTLVNYVHDNAGDIAKLVSDVETNSAAIATNKAAHEKNTSDIVAINNTIAAIVQPKESDEISVAEDGTLGVKEVNVSKLVQTDGDTLVLNGGTANVKVAE